MPKDTLSQDIDYSVIVPAYNSEDPLPGTLEAICNARKSLSQWKGEIIVVDNNSTDDTGEIGRSHGARVVFESENRIPKARNVGAVKARGRYLIWIDDDTKISAELLRETLTLLDFGDVAGGSTVVSTTQYEHPHYRLSKAGFWLWNTYSRTRKIGVGMYLFALQGAWESVGGFREDLFVGDEISFSRAVREWGKDTGMEFKILNIPVDTSLRKFDRFPAGTVLYSQFRAIFSERYRKGKHSFWYGPD